MTSLKYKKKKKKKASNLTRESAFIRLYFTIGCCQSV